MSDTDRTPQIRLEVDQEVFVDAVRETDVVEDATVATEITSFDRVKDAYVLEGAVVFGGYLRHADGNASQKGDAFSFDFEEDGDVEHFHHRMPFTIHVPVKTHARGIMNVNSRISAWKLEVMGDGWIRVLADLHVTGLSGSNGYRFSCGSQEDGSFASDELTQDTKVSTEGQAGPTDDTESAFEPELELVRGSAEDGDVDTADVRADAPANAAEVAGGGDEVIGAEVTDSDNAPVHHTMAYEARADLQGFDRALEGAASSGEMTEDFPESTARTLGDASQDARGTVAEFEFVNQVEEPPIPVDRAEADESFVASRSFSEDGFKATAGFVPSVHLGSRGEEDVQPEAEEFAEDSESGEFRGHTPALSRDLWSFVDLSGPDNKYTLRYIVVSEDEPVAAVAERIGCDRDTLVRHNRLVDDVVHPGQTLFVPK